MPTVESILTRELDVRFIDARMITAEAKLAMGIHGYATKEQQQKLRDEAVRIFYAKSEGERASMQLLHFQLEAVKTPTGSICDDDESLCMSSNHSDRSGVRRMFSRRI